ncbi:MAG: site-2 protease family protein [Parcubacteria group bacterium]|nr:site-2 protease family protein [Parcubacteria group bacterium]
MRKFNIPIKKIGWSFVRVEREGDIEKLDLKDQIYISGAGPLSSIIFGTILLTIAGIRVNPLAIGDFQINLLLWAPVVALTIIIFARWCCQYIIPLVGLLEIILLSDFLFWLFTHSLNDIIGEPISASTIRITAQQTVENVGIVFTATFIAGFCSLFSGALNMLPFYPIDGGRIVRAYIKTFSVSIADWFAIVGYLLYIVIRLVLAIGFVVFLLSSDLEAFMK